MTPSLAAGAGFPVERPRRLRSTPGLRRLVAETRLHRPTSSNPSSSRTGCPSRGH